MNVDSTNPKTEIPSSIQRELTCEQIKTFIRIITKYNQLISFDITELNLHLGSSDQQKTLLDNTIVFS